MKIKRFNITNKGYRYDKLIFYSAFIVPVSYILILFSIFGFQFHPYINCKTSSCDNPFYSESTYQCSWVFGLIKCPVKYYSWMNEKTLPKGEYGIKPIETTSFLMVLFSMIILAFVINHGIWNRGKAIHLNIMDKIEELK